jgi:hypothetical protein
VAHLERKRNLPPFGPLAHKKVQIGATDAAGGYLHHHLARTGFGYLTVLENERSILKDQRVFAFHLFLSR